MWYSLLVNWRVWTAIALFGAGWMTNGWRLNAEIEGLKADYSQEVAQSKTQALIDADVQRDREKALQRKVDDANKKLQSDAKLIAGMRTDTGRMRKSIADYAKGTSAADQSAAACGDRAEKLGILLDDALRVSETCARDGETESANVRGLLGSWPR